jgi:hypothetical protein
MRYFFVLARTRAVGFGRVPPSKLATHADHEAAATRSRQVAAEGRMDTDELERRVADAHRACTIADLTTVTADLPAPAAPRTSATPTPTTSRANSSRGGFGIRGRKHALTSDGQD